MNTLIYYVKKGNKSKDTYWYLKLVKPKKNRLVFNLKQVFLFNVRPTYKTAKVNKIKSTTIFSYLLIYQVEQNKCSTNSVKRNKTKIVLNQSSKDIRILSPENRKTWLDF